MLADSWPLQLFWLLSFVTITFAAGAYAIGEFRDRCRKGRGGRHE